ncbi:uncharacterized protein [Littorina saxatilis]|uniref:uncharacterized protein n=1 Tax=Littorina saxatilis TaxID=31220 RepID=UPI0038B549B8
MAVDVAPRPQWQMFPPPRLPLFTSGEDGCSLDDFVTEARRIIAHFNLGALGGETAEWLIQSLAGPARREVNLHPPQETATANFVLNILQDTFGDHTCVVAQMSAFYERNQSQEESVLDYAHALQATQMKVNAVEPDTLKDITLRGHFINGLCLPELRRDLREFARKREGASFAVVRAEALRWMGEDFELVKQAAAEESSALNEMHVEVSALAAKSTQLSVEMNHRVPAVPKVASGKLLPSSKPRCWICGRSGHLQSRCPAKRPVCKQPLSWRQPSEPYCVGHRLAVIRQVLREQASQTDLVSAGSQSQETVPPPVKLADAEQPCESECNPFPCSPAPVRLPPRPLRRTFFPKLVI